MEGKWRKPVRRKGKVKMMHLVIRSPDGQQGHGGTFFGKMQKFGGLQFSKFLNTDID